MTGFSAGTAIGAAADVAQGFFGLFGGFAQAKALKQDARQRELIGIAEANDIARQGREAEAFGAAQAGASGFTLEGSATDVLARLGAEAETAAQRARWEAYRDADQARYEAKIRKRQGILGFAGAFLGAAGKVFG